MAKTTVTRSCGHSETVNISGPYAGRERQSEYEATKLCRPCWQAKADAEKAAANTQAAEAAQTAGRPELTGSEKQIAWATTIRETMAPELQKGRVAVNENPQATDEYRAIINAIIDRIEAETSASWWIDNRDVHPLRIIRAAATADETAKLTAIVTAAKA